MFRYVPRTIPTKIFVIGCGGTGSRLVPLLSQFMKTVTAGANPRGTVVDPVIYLIDDDHVSDKNLTRQNFIASDVGKNKAEVLAQRYGRAYGVNIIPIVRRVEAGESGRTHRLFNHLDVPPVTPGDNSLVIMCVDSAKARRDILSAWSTDKMRSAAYRRSADVPEILPVFIDAGNEDDFGQVRIFQRATINAISRDVISIQKRLTSMRPEVQDIHCLPMDVDFYRNLQDNEGASCADLDQTLAINALMATLIMGMVQNLYYLKPFTYHSMSISLSGGVSVEHITAEYLLGLATQEEFPFGLVPSAFNVCEVVDQYIDSNTATLRRMGLNKDGTRYNRRTSSSDQQQETTVVEDTSSTEVSSEAEVNEEAQAEVVDMSSREARLSPERADYLRQQRAEAIRSYVQENQEIAESVAEASAVNATTIIHPFPYTTAANPFAYDNVVTTSAPQTVTTTPVYTPDDARSPIAPATSTPVTPPPLRPGVVNPGHSLAG